ncbi:MAG: RNA polymerase subunit sigma-24 [Dehalococcoidia bacterium]|nr:RNA polymerase subunit sigma-24 [Dehalococcoidia bacterium]
MRAVEYDRLDDEALVQKVVAGDERALETLYTRYARPVYALALKLLAQTEAAEEVAQEVFVRLWTRADRFQARRGRLVSWLLAITHHRAIDELRRRKTDRARRAAAEAAAPLEEDGDLSADAALAEDRQAVRTALHQLPDTQRRPLELAYYYGLTQTEIAAHLDQPLGTIKTRMRLGMMKLRDTLTAAGIRPASTSS